MRYTNFIIFIVSIFLGSNQLHAQIESAVDTSKNILLFKEASGGIILHTQGWGLKFSKGYNKTAFKKRMLVFEFIEMNSLKQIKSINPYYANSKRYVYGKLNSVFIIRASYGIHRLLNRKPYWGGVELRLLYSGGASLGFAKPTYLYISNPSPEPQTFYRTEERYDPYEHFPDNIIGRGPFTSGFSEIGFYPGIHARIGLDFDYGVYQTKVKSLEIGATLDLFPRPVPIMAFNDPSYFFLTLYLNFNFGKRYN